MNELPDNIFPKLIDANDNDDGETILDIDDLDSLDDNNVKFLFYFKTFF